MKYQKAIIVEEGIEREVNIITILSSEKYESIYLVYSNEEIKNEKSKICFAKISEENNRMELINIPTAEELKEVEKLFNEEVRKNVK